MPDRAMARLAPITEHDPNDPFYLCYQAEAAIGMGGIEKGIQLATRARDIASVSPYAFIKTRVEEFTSTSPIGADGAFGGGSH